ncbi:MAG: esterase-like activity of phytase family protein [Pseudomonadota bacterium]
MRRLIFVLLIALGLAPGTFVRSPAQLSLDGRSVEVMRLSLAPSVQTQVKGSLKLTGAWELTADHHFFGGFSALVARGDGTFLAGTDRGWALTLPIEKNAPLTAPLDMKPVGREKRTGFEHIDLEALSWDEERGELWAGYEHGNVIERIDADGTRHEIRPVAMKDWVNNRAAETLTHLGDGRILVISETPERNSKGVRYHDALVFPRNMFDEGVGPTAFRFVSHRNYRPVDATLMSDGRVAILLREAVFSLPPRFKSAIMIADPRLITPGGAWTGPIAMEMNSGSLTDNYEGIAWANDPNNDPDAQTQNAPQSGALYIISDDNFANFQRTLMLRLEWE